MTLLRYYKQENITYKTVDLHAVHKLLKADEIRDEQRKYCIDIMKLQASKAVFWLDETSINIHMRRKNVTWTNGRDVFMPYQSKSTRNRTIIAAVGGRDEEIFFHHSIAKRTNKEEVLKFLKEFLLLVPYAKQDVVVVTDNHSAHKSKVVQKYMASQNVDYRFMPVYSSVFSPQERVWSMIKSEWSK